MRKDAGFEVVDHIYLYVENNEKIQNIVKKNINDISRQLLADKVLYEKSPDGFEKEWNSCGIFSTKA